MARLVAPADRASPSRPATLVRWGLPLALLVALVVLVVRLVDPLAARRAELVLSTWWINARWAWAVDVAPGAQTAVTIFLGLFIEVLPFLLLGALVSAALAELVPAATLERLMPRGGLAGTLVGSCLGLLVPVCECGVIPVGRRLMAKGVSPAPVLAFMLAGPAANPIAIAATWLAFSLAPWLVAARVALTIAIAVAVALATAPMIRPERVATGDEGSPPSGDARQPAAIRLQRVLDRAAGESFELGRFVVLGCLLAASAQILIPQTSLLRIGQGPVVSVALLQATAVLISACSSVGAFIALSFASSFAPGALLAFLVYGPMIDLKSLLLLGAVLERRVVVAIAALAGLLALAAGIAINLLAGGSG